MHSHTYRPSCLDTALILILEFHLRTQFPNELRTLSITFDKNVVPETQATTASCKAQLVTLKPGEHSQIITPNLLGITYRATAAGTTNATIIFKYAVEIPTSKSPISDTYSRTYAFEIQPGSQQPATTSTISTSAPTTKSTSEPGPLKLPIP